MATVTKKTIDIDKILRQKMGAKAKFVPGLLVRWLKHIVHEDEVNAYLWESRDKTGVDWLEECVKYLDMTLEVEGSTPLSATIPLAGKTGLPLVPSSGAITMAVSVTLSMTC